MSAEKFDRREEVGLEVQVERVRLVLVPGVSCDAGVNQAIGPFKKGRPARFVSVVAFDETIDEGCNVVTAGVVTRERRNVVARSGKLFDDEGAEETDAPVIATRIERLRKAPLAWRADHARDCQ